VYETLGIERPGAVPVKRLWQLTRLIREIAALPRPDDPAPPAPGQREPGTGARFGGATRGAMASVMKSG